MKKRLKKMLRFVYFNIVIDISHCLIHQEKFSSYKNVQHVPALQNKA